MRRALRTRRPSPSNARAHAYTRDDGIFRPPALQWGLLAVDSPLGLGTRQSGCSASWWGREGRPHPRACSCTRPPAQPNPTPPPPPLAPAVFFLFFPFFLPVRFVWCLFPSGLLSLMFVSLVFVSFRPLSPPLPFFLLFPPPPPLLVLWVSGCSAPRVLLLFLCVALCCWGAVCCAVSLAMSPCCVVPVVVCCRVLVCNAVCFAVLCPWVRCCAALLRVAPPGIVLFCAVLCCVARLVPLLAVLCPRALSIALRSCGFWCRSLWFPPALCAFCCVRLAVVCWCMLLFAAVLCAVCVCCVCPCKNHHAHNPAESSGSACHVVSTLDGGRHLGQD